MPRVKQLQRMAIASVPEIVLQHTVYTFHRKATIACAALRNPQA